MLILQAGTIHAADHVDIFSQVLALTSASGHAMPIRSLCFSPDSQLLITASDDCQIKIYDVYVFKIIEL